MKYFSIAIFILLGLAQCQKPYEGCNDPIAKNYNADADKFCCCQYYQLQVNARHFGQDSSQAFQFSHAYADANSDSFKILTNNILVSNIHLVDTINHVEIGVEDTISFGLLDFRTARVENNFTTLNPNVFLSTIGKFTTFSTYQLVRFTVGITPSLQQINTATITPSTHPLATTASPNMYDASENQYFTYYTKINLPLSNDTLIFNDTDTIQIQLPCNITVQDGADTKINLDISHARLFDNISFANDSTSAIKTKIKQNWNNVFRVR